jgi:hypothetical protein
MNNVKQFPTDLVRAEVEIDRAHKRWLSIAEKRRANIDYDITIQYNAFNHEPVNCSYYNMQLTNGKGHILLHSLSIENEMLELLLGE